MNPITLVVLLWGAFAASDPVRSAAGDRAALPDTAAASLRNDLDRILAQSRLTTDAGVVVLSLDRGDTLFQHNSTLPLVPASNLKLFTSLAALHYLGASFRYNTYLLATGPLVDGVVEGDVVLYGTGDPTLSDRFGAGVLESFADTLVALGVREIRGGVVGDASYFSGMGIGIGWQAKYSNAPYAAPSSALSLSENVASLLIRPAATAGGRPTIQIAPGGDGIEVLNRATTVAQGRTRVRLARTGYDSPLTVRGQVSRRSRGIRYSVPVTDPPLYAAAALRESIEARGILVQGPTRAVRATDGSRLAGRVPFAPAFATADPVHVLAIHTSPPLLDILEVVNKRSNNFMAEQVIRTVGRVALGDGTVEGGTAAVTRFAISTLGLDSAEVAFYDGSGLSPLNRVTPRSIIRLLEYASGSAFWPSFWTTLPESGAPDGIKRMLGTPAEGRVRAKTGTISRVSALSGYVTTVGGERLAFSILNNRASNSWRAKRAEDAIVVRLATFDRAAHAAGPASGPHGPGESR